MKYRTLGQKDIPNQKIFFTKKNFNNFYREITSKIWARERSKIVLKEHDLNKRTQQIFVQNDNIPLKKDLNSVDKITPNTSKNKTINICQTDNLYASFNNKDENELRFNKSVRNSTKIVNLRSEKSSNKSMLLNKNNIIKVNNNGFDYWDLTPVKTNCFFIDGIFRYKRIKGNSN